VLENNKVAGRIVHDLRGNAVWDWAIETGVLAKATVAELLNSLVNSVANNMAQPQPLTLEVEADRTRGWSGDPYNRSRR
jgi:hypothetical protein